MGGSVELRALSGQWWRQHVASALGLEAGADGRRVGLAVVGRGWDRGPACVLSQGCVWACWLHSGLVLSKCEPVKVPWVHMTYGWVITGIDFCWNNLGEALERPFWDLKGFGS